MKNNIILKLSPAIADHLAVLINSAKFSGSPNELKATLQKHDELIARFNEAVKAANEPEEARAD